MCRAANNGGEAGTPPATRQARLLFKDGQAKLEAAARDSGRDGAWDGVQRGVQCLRLKWGLPRLGSTGETASSVLWDAAWIYGRRRCQGIAPAAWCRGCQSVIAGHSCCDVCHAQRRHMRHRPVSCHVCRRSISLRRPPCTPTPWWCSRGGPLAAGPRAESRSAAGRSVLGGRPLGAACVASELVLGHRLVVGDVVAPGVLPDVAAARTAWRGRPAGESRRGAMGWRPEGLTAAAHGPRRCLPLSIPLGTAVALCSCTPDQDIPSVPARSLPHLPHKPWPLPLPPAAYHVSHIIMRSPSSSRTPQRQRTSQSSRPPAGRVAADGDERRALKGGLRWRGTDAQIVHLPGRARGYARAAAGLSLIGLPAGRTRVAPADCPVQAPPIDHHRGWLRRRCGTAACHLCGVAGARWRMLLRRGQQHVGQAGGQQRRALLVLLCTLRQLLR